MIKALDLTNQIGWDSKTPSEQRVAIKAAYDFVHNLYPNAGIKNIIALHAPKSLLEDCGYKGVGGFYDCNNRVIVVSDTVSATEQNEFDIHAEYTLDEVLCHEMIHYGANFDKPLANRHLEEEIAYGKTAGYLRSKGRDDNFIIEKNMMPYLMSVVDRPTVLQRVISKECITFDDMNKMTQEQQDAVVNRLRPKLAKEMIVMAKEIGQRIISFYYPQTEPETKITHQFASKRKLILDDDE